jgi:Rod binding domain-containing protein
MSAGLPPIDVSAVPAGVRAQGTAAVQRYEAALSFEGVLDEQLTQALAQSLQDAAAAGDDSGDGSDDGSDSSDPSMSMTIQMLPQTLAQSLVSHGGLGLAPQLYTALGGSLEASPAGDAQTGSAPVGGAR